MKRPIRLVSLLAALLLLTACSTAEEAGETVSEPAEAETSEAVVEEETSEPAAEETGEPEADTDAGAAEDQTIAEFAAENPSFGTLVQALEAAGIMDQLEQQGPLTVFAPNDEAFSQLNQDDLTALLADPAQLTDILEYHIVEGEALSSDLEDGQTLTTLQGEDLTVSIDGDTVMVDGATVVEPDVEVGNGVIHVIDGVIRPPSS